MPRRIIENALAKYNQSNPIKVYGDNTITSKDKAVIRRMAAYIGVSYTALVIRLRDMGLFEYHNILEYISNELNLGGVFSMRLQTQVAPEIQKRLLLSRVEAESLKERDILCPTCGFRIQRVFSDATGHLSVKCQKCKNVHILNLAYFRRIRRNGYGRNCRR